ncbi:MAG TPA: energy transducer TonB [Nevskia sp.]|nr:energy transducer TonB [Nevskia sp.]
MRLLPMAVACLWATVAAAQSPQGSAEPPGIRLLEAPAPDYPPAERAAGHQGQVLLRLRLTPAGAVDTVEVAQSSGFAALDQAALEAARNWKFAPLVPAQAGPVMVQRPVRFSLGVPDRGGASANRANALSRPAMESMLRQPCRQVNDEAAAFRHQHPGGKLADMQTFRASAGMLFMDAHDQPMPARLKLFGSLDKAWPLVLQRCAAEPAAIYGQVMKETLARAEAEADAAK